MFPEDEAQLIDENRREMAEWAKAAKVDNASNLDDVNDRHPCGPGPILGHSFSDGECQDCGYCCEHENMDPAYDGTCECGIFCPADEAAAYDDSDDQYEAYKADIIESGGHWPPWRDNA